ncbi:MAG: NAD(P)/FAD-dependent oxidoreductase [Spirochaetales bacterium]|nr:NAD(P)/FAD-dependent oxidoreductase [Spirochaetales bacterium]
MSSVYDVAIIGAGVTGASIARRLSAYKLRVVLLEKECDVSFGVSKANSGIIHGGFHHGASTLKSRLEIQGNIMFDALQRDLHFPFRRCGILVAALSFEEMKTVEKLYMQGVQNGSIGIELCNRERMLSLEPKLNRDVVGGLHAPSGGIVEPYRLVFSLVESAVKNGVELKTKFKVNGVDITGERFHISSVNGETVTSRYAVNAAGLRADEISKLFKAEEFTISPRKGEEYLMDRNAAAFTSRVIFPVPSPNSKGMLVIPTVEGTTMVGPTAEEIEDKEDLATTGDNFEKVFYSARRLVPSVSERDIITAFVGLRPALEGNDFYIAISTKCPKLVQAAGIQSPGLTAAPAIGEYVKDLLKKAGLILEEKPNYDPAIDPLPRIREVDPFTAEKLIEKNPSYGNIVCRCESISEAEIVEAIKKGHTTLDGIKFYTRAQMGRCQGGFCTYKILKIIQRETGLSVDEITKRGAGSWEITGRVGEFQIFSRTGGKE